MHKDETYLVASHPDTAVLRLAGRVGDSKGKIARLPSQAVDQLRPDFQPQSVHPEVRNGGWGRKRDIHSCNGRGPECRIAETAAAAADTEMIPHVIKIGLGKKQQNSCDVQNYLMRSNEDMHHNFVPPPFVCECIVVRSFILLGTTTA